MEQEVHQLNTKKTRANTVIAAMGEVNMNGKYEELLS